MLPGKIETSRRVQSTFGGGSKRRLLYLVGIDSYNRRAPGAVLQRFENAVKVMHNQAHRFSIAPMMEWTDRHCRYFHRLMTRRALLYTEMITTGAVLHGDRTLLLGFDPSEHPVAVQLGGCDPDALAASARICADLGYDEINLNVGCPSDRVQNGRFGACLMAEPQLVGDCVAAMKAAVAVPVTVKCRIGIDDQDPEGALDELADAVVAAGVDRLIVHARKAWLKGLSPRQNRDVPPLDYARVHRLKARLPGLDIVLNGGIATVQQAAAHLTKLDGVMMGRAAYQEPWRLLDVDPLLFGAPAPMASARMAAEALIPYVEREAAAGARANSILRHAVGLFHAVPGARAFRRHLSTAAVKPGAGSEVLRDALALIAPDRGERAESAAA
jgi:tRNA-dihydrouridine synthase A